MEVTKQYGQAIENKDHKIIGFILFNSETERKQQLKILEPNFKSYGVVFSQRLVFGNNIEVSNPNQPY